MSIPTREIIMASVKFTQTLERADLVFADAQRLLRELTAVAEDLHALTSLLRVAVERGHDASP